INLLTKISINFPNLYTNLLIKDFNIFSNIISLLQGNSTMEAILADPGYSMKKHFAFTVYLLFLKQWVTSMLNYATLLGKILLIYNVIREQYLLHTTSLEKKELQEYILKSQHDFGYNFVKNVIEVVRYWYKCTQDARN